MLLTILLTIQILLSIALTGVILLQRSEGGALGMGGGPSGFMTARGAGNLLTRITGILAFLFFVTAIALTIAGNLTLSNRSGLDAEAVGMLQPGEVAPAAPTPGEALPGQPPAAPAAPSLDDLPVAGAAPAPSEAPAQ